MNSYPRLLMLIALFATSFAIHGMGDADGDLSIASTNQSINMIFYERTKPQVISNINTLNSDKLSEKLSRLLIGNDHWTLEQDVNKSSSEKRRNYLILAKYIQKKNNAAIEEFHKENKAFNIDQKSKLHKDFLTTQALPQANTILTQTQNEHKRMKPAYLFRGFLSTCVGVLGIGMLFKSYQQMNPVLATGGIAATGASFYGMYKCFKIYEPVRKAKNNVAMIENLVNLKFSNNGKEEQD